MVMSCKNGTYSGKVLESIFMFEWKNCERSLLVLKAERSTVAILKSATLLRRKKTCSSVLLVKLYLWVRLATDR